MTTFWLTLQCVGLGCIGVACLYAAFVSLNTKSSKGARRGR